MTGIDDRLLVTLGANVISAATLLFGGLFVLLHNWRREVNILFFFITFTTFLYTLFFIVASLQTEHDAAYFWWFLNIVDVFITMAAVHLMFCVAGNARSWRWFIVATYFVGLAILGAALLSPHWFLPDVVPKLYFPYYLTAGPGYMLMLAYFFIGALIAFINLVATYVASSGVERLRLEYFVLMFAIGYAVGSLNFLLVFDIPFDPVFGSLVGLYIIPIAYGIYATDLLDIRLVFRRAFYYATGIAFITAFLMALILLNDFLVATIPRFQFWTVPFVVAIVAYSVGRSVWKQARESEKLKYEFITVATHKLRTPMTRIRWIIPELLEKAGTNQEVREGVRRIDDANNRLIELTNVLLETTHPGGSYDYQQIPLDMRHLAWEAVKHFSTQISEKKLSVTVDAPNEIYALGDRRRLDLVVEVLIENAIMYTPEGGKINLTVTPENRRVRFAVTDTGIGVNAEDQEHIFSSFYRTSAARAVDTEGVGLGLSLAKTIVERQNGHLGVESQGEGKGSTFWFTIPMTKA